MADSKTTEFLGTGRRKTSVARVRLSSGSGKVTVNGRAFETYFPTDSLRMVVQQPLVVTNNTDKFDVRVNVTGGGPADKAGIQPGDVITQLGETQVRSTESLGNALTTLQPGQQIKVTYLREGKSATATVTLGTL